LYFVRSARNHLTEWQKTKSLIGLLGKLLWAYLHLDGTHPLVFKHFAVTVK
jgi:hypothetical protein